MPVIARSMATKQSRWIATARLRASHDDKLNGAAAAKGLAALREDRTATRRRSALGYSLCGTITMPQSAFFITPLAVLPTRKS